MKIRVYYEDTDAGGIVYHTNYIKYCERARSEVFFSQNMMPHMGDRSGFVVRDIKASYLATSTLGDLLEVRSHIQTIKNSSLVLVQDIFKDESKIFTMEVVLVYIEEGQPKRIPDLLRHIFDSF